MSERFHKNGARFYPCKRCDSTHPSVTTLLDVMASKGLMSWLATNGTAKLNTLDQVAKVFIEPIVYEKVRVEAESLWTKTEDTQFWKSGNQIGQQAADYGTLAHAWIEAHLNGKQADFGVLPDPAKRAIDTFVEWEKQHDVKVVETEKTFYGCEFNVAGTADLVAYIDGELTLMDHKTAKGIYWNYIIQCWSYCLCDEAQNGDRLYKQTAIGRWGKDGVSEFKIYKRRDFPGIEDARKIILACGEIFEVQQKWNELYPYKGEKKNGIR